jgi:hypothetical protein
MKGLVLFIFLLSSCFGANAVTKTWVALPGPGLIWSQGSNWAPIGVPNSTDDVIITAFSGTIIIDAGTPIPLNSIKVTGLSNVIFSCNISKNFRLSSTSTLTPGLLIDAGSILTLYAAVSGANGSFDLTWGNGVIGSIYGTLIFSGVMNASTGPKLITTRSPVVANLYGIATFYSGGIIRIMPNADNTDAALSPVPTLVMKNGSVYESLKDGGSFPVGTWESNSLARVLSPGSNLPTFLGTTYGNLEWNCPMQNNFSFGADISFNSINLVNTNSLASKAFRITNSSATPRSLTVNGDLTISAFSILEITGAGALAGGGGTLNLKGHLNNAGILTSTGMTGTTNDFILNGISNQNLTNIGTLSGPRLSFVMNNAAGATLLSPFQIPNKLTLTSGKIKTTSTNILIMVDNAPPPTGSSSSFVEGPMKKGGHDDSFTFPIGKGSIYAPLYVFSVGMPATDTFRAEYIRSNPQGIYGNGYDPVGNPEVINHISFVEHWSLLKTNGTMLPTNVTLTVTDYSFCKVWNTTFVSRYNTATSQWKNCGTGFKTQTSFGPLYVAGTITSAPVTIDGIFTLGTSDIYSVNPLPINLISFYATKINTAQASVSWELAAICSPEARFEIQRAGSGRNFTAISTMRGNTSGVIYNYTDNGLKNGINYYRLRMEDANGVVSYSRTVAIMNGVDGLLLTSLIPTVTAHTAVLTVSSSKEQKLDLVITDMQGRMIRKLSYTVPAGNTNINIATSSFAAGIYQLTGISEEGKTNTIRFIRQ